MMCSDIVGQGHTRYLKVRVHKFVSALKLKYTLEVDIAVGLPCLILDLTKMIKFQSTRQMFFSLVFNTFLYQVSLSIQSCAEIKHRF